MVDIVFQNTVTVPRNSYLHRPFQLFTSPSLSQLSSLRCRICSISFCIRCTWNVGRTIWMFWLAPEAIHCLPSQSQGEQHVLRFTRSNGSDVNFRKFKCILQGGGGVSYFGSPTTQAGICFRFKVFTISSVFTESNKEILNQFRTSSFFSDVTTILLQLREKEHAPIRNTHQRW